VARGEVAVFASNLLFKFVQVRGKEFNGTAALGADHVVMTAPVVLVLVSSDAVVKCYHAGKAAIGEQL
jgi:hypothetical protein